jgi:hypothetical protein
MKLSSFESRSSAVQAPRLNRRMVAQVDGKPRFRLWCQPADAIGTQNSAVFSSAGGHETQKSVNHAQVVAAVELESRTRRKNERKSCQPAAASTSPVTQPNNRADFDVDQLMIEARTRQQPSD